MIPVLAEFSGQQALFAGSQTPSRRQNRATAVLEGP